MTQYNTITMAVTEVWKQFRDNDNYEVSSFGKIKNKKTGRLLKPANKGGYLYVGLSLNCIKRSYALHRIVAITFLSNPENKPHVNHLDKNKVNNNISNLEWVTALENNIHKSNGVIQTTNQNLKIWRVEQNTNEKLQLYNSIQEAAKWCVDNGYSSSEYSIKGNISNAIRGVYSKSSGFKWCLAEQLIMENEIWKNVNIDNNEFIDYFVSNLGRFKNSKGIIMENYKPHHSGYIYVRVNKEKYALHRLVASTFITNLENKPFVNHIDGNKINNSVDNLEWVTCKENNQHNHNIGLIKCFTRKIVQYDLELNKIKEYNSIIQAIRETNITSIKEVLYNKQKTAGGFIWKYAD